MNQFQPQSGAQFIHTSLTIEWPRRLFIFSTFLAGIILVITLGLRYGYESYLARAISEKDTALEGLAKQIPDADREGFIAFYSQLLNLKSVLTNHTTAGGLFTWLERNINAHVSITRFNLTMKTNTLTIDGLAASYKDLSEQLTVLQMLPEVDRYSVDQSQASDRGIQFKLAVVLKNTVFKAP